MKFKDFHINIKIRIIETFISTFIGSMIFPFMAIYFFKHFGEEITGLLLLFNVFIGICINFFGGYISDRVGRKKLMLYAEIARFFAFFTMMVFNSPWVESVMITFLMMTVNTICWGFSGPAHQAMLIDVSTPEQRKLMYSITYWANNLSIAIGGILGGLLFETHLFELLMALSIASLITVSLITFFIKESYFPNPEEESTSHIKKIFTTYNMVFKDRLFIWLVLAGVLILSMEFNLANYIGIRLSEEMTNQQFFSWEITGVQMLGFLRTENTILVASLAIFAAKFIERFKERAVLVTGCLLFVAGYGFISFSNNIWLLFIVMVIATVGEVIRVPVEQSSIASLPPDDARSSYMAIKGMTFHLSMLVSSTLVTISAFLSSYVMAIIITCIGLVGTSIYYVIFPKVQLRIKENQF
ncbi:MDR family MFS transporter [Chengkuizengella axinellae]|uniref:MFS transporter n=1 Tax=Chengkuizengella axinellae TaxID=3064388 RepID=A0ABT9J4H4_9BACL|nr:MFS transporter [Chengkuizengella sp. 2205SS18-9]MDP5276501.1 MFS transporter [Chengkuizengella sp. 2205SS18-9]